MKSQRKQPAIIVDPPTPKELLDNNESFENGPAHINLGACRDESS